MRITSQDPTRDQPTHIVTYCTPVQSAYAATSLTLAMVSPSHSRFPCLSQHNYFSGAMRPCVKRKASIGIDNLEHMLEEAWQGRCPHSPSQACPCYWNLCPIGLAHIVGFICPVTTRPTRKLAIYCLKLYSIVNRPFDRTRKLLVFPVRLLHRTPIHDPTSHAIVTGLASTKG